MERNLQRHRIGFCIVSATMQRNTRSEVVLLRQPLSCALGRAIQSVRSNLATRLKFQPAAKFRFPISSLVLNRNRADPRPDPRGDVHKNVPLERVGSGAPTTL